MGKLGKWINDIREIIETTVRGDPKGAYDALVDIYETTKAGTAQQKFAVVAGVAATSAVGFALIYTVAPFVAGSAAVAFVVNTAIALGPAAFTGVYVHDVVNSIGTVPTPKIPYNPALDETDPTPVIDAPPTSTVGNGIQVPLQPGDLDSGGSGGDGQERTPPGPQVSETTYQNVISGLNAIAPRVGTIVDTFRRTAEWVDRTFFGGRDGSTGSPAAPGQPGAVGTGDWGDGTRGDGGSSGKPIVLDLDDDGVELVPLEESTAFYDINGDGYQYNLGWAGKDDGILGYDKNADGKINRRGEISFVDYVEGAKTDLEGLRHFDSNKDGILDSRDAEFGKFRVWQDADQDGISDAGELKTLAQAGIRSINLQYAADDDGESEALDGNIIFGEGEFVKTDGARQRYADVMFNTATVGYRWNGDALEFNTADGPGKIRIAPNGANAGLNMNFRHANNAQYTGAVGGAHADILSGAGVSRDLALSGGAGPDRLTGGSGDDWLAGGAGADILRGGSGDDALFFDARDDVHGGSGQDVGVVSGSGAINLSMGAVGLEALHSGDGNDRLSGFDSAQGVIIDGGGGDDTMRGSHQRDVLSGGDGDDYIKGHKGEDVVLGGAGDDRLEGNRGDDLVYGGAGNDRLYGLIDDDRLFGGAGNDDLDGGYGDDRLEGGAGSDTYSFTYSDFGSDTIRDSGGNDTVNIMGRRHEDVWLSRHGDDLRISVLGAEDEVLVEGQFGGAGNQIETLAAGQWGTVVTAAGRSVTEVVYDEKGPHFVSIDALVNAMAAFDKPQTGWSEMSSRERANVDAAWSAVGVWKYPEGGATLSTTLVTVAA